MKLLSTQLSYLLSQQQTRRNLKALLKYVIFLTVLVLIYAVLFHWIMATVEEQDHSWLTGVYWTLTVMSTLGFGDITFSSDVGRAFSILVLISGIVLLLIVLPFAFIRFFYAPWLEAQIRLRAPRDVPLDTSGHVIICRHDETVAQGLIKKLKVFKIPYYVVEPDATVAANLFEDGVSVVTGEIDNSATYSGLQAPRARMVLANSDDAANTNITLTVREIAPAVPVVAIAESPDSVDILELAGATHVLPLKQKLGEHLAYRVTAEHANVHVIGAFEDLLIAEFPVHHTPLAGRRIRETQLRQLTGVNVVGIWERGRLLPARPDTLLSESSVPVVAGTAAQIAEIESFLVIYNTNYNPVLVMGSGNVGYAAACALKRKNVAFNVVEKNEALRQRVEGIANQVFTGDAADRGVLMRAGLAEAPSIVITTNDDAMNIYLTVYCRRLNPDLRIVSRITHERNLEAIHRAGADFVLSYASLGAESVFSILQQRELMMLGEGIDLFVVRVPESLAGKRLGETQIGAEVGLTVIAIRKEGELVTNPRADALLAPESDLLMIGSVEQRDKFIARFGS
ncbi:MAG: NAD-binding protein [Syntrophobacteraceae bacterium]|jgi:Trk K+ transport system NAD-binding subunit|nr:NAD-binding protein [Syntrophobacteraceae bacterium]